MFEDMNPNSITVAGVIMLIYLSVMIMFFYLLSTPVNAIFDGLSGTSLGEATDEMATFLPWIRTAVNMVFAIGIATPITWFIFWIFNREPDFSRYRR